MANNLNNNFEREEFQAPLSEINITPLVDVILVLLVVLLITAPVINNAINLDLPTQKAVQNSNQQAQSISITNNNQIIFNKTAIKIENLALELEKIAKNNPKTQINLQIEKKVPFEKAVEILSILQKYQLSNIAFITKDG